MYAGGWGVGGTDSLKEKQNAVVGRKGLYAINR